MSDMELDIELLQPKLLASLVASLAIPKGFLNWSGSSSLNWSGSSPLIAAQTRQVAASVDKAILNMLLGNTTSEANEIYQSA